ncbi:hypothetical protein HY988_00590 [Candidatus Micrarchaeota archaeon]|nr:hypothetical protein [Candidatus Micrarchaeota archaeon]
MKSVEEKIDALLQYKNALPKEERGVVDALIAYAREMHATIEERKRMELIANF